MSENASSASVSAPAIPAPETGSVAIIEAISKSVQVISVVVGVVLSVMTFSDSRDKESLAPTHQAEAAEAQAEATKLEITKYYDQRNAEEAKRQAEAAAPFIKLRQELYLETIRTVAVLTNPDGHTPEEVNQCKNRFRELYITELSFVEGVGVEGRMRGLANHIDEPLTQLTDGQRAALDLAHALRDSLAKSWGINERVVDNPHQ